jgi:hypothetical protein
MVSNNGSVDANLRTLWYIGTDTLQEGYALCYDQDATTDNADPKLRLGSAVEKPATANLNAFAGLVAPQSAGKTGPCWVDVIVPTRNQIVTAYTKANATAWSTALAPANASYALAAHADATLNLPLVAVACETHDSSTTEANKKVMFR